MIIRHKLLGILAVLSLLAVPTSAAAAGDEPWIFEGGGWGHGVGMSQFGALGQVQDGRTVAQVLAHYYEGSSIGTLQPAHWTNSPEGLRVGLIQDTNPSGPATAVHVKAIGNGVVAICHPSTDCSLANESLTTVDTWHFDVREDPIDPEQAECRVRRGTSPDSNVWPWGPCDAKLTQPGATSTRVDVNGTEYARGTIYFSPSDNGFHTVVALPMEEYLYGLAEVPSSWPHDVLQVQAIAGRSFALATAADRGGGDGTATLGECGCHLYATTVDQAYAGWSKEDPSNEGQAWTDAVDASSGDIVTHPGSTRVYDVVKAFYSSSNGGASENNEDVWNGTPLPWLRSVADPWSADPAVNPLATWSVKVADDDLAVYFGWDHVSDATVLTGPPGVIVSFTGVDDGNAVSANLNGTQLAALVKEIGYGYNAPGSASSSIRVSPWFTSVTDPPGFDDISGHTFEADIEWARDTGVTKGCNPPDNNLFCPDDDVTRGQMAAFITRFLDLPATGTDFFIDDNGNTFENDINRLAAAGITKGCNPPDNDRFCPDDELSREQMAAFIVRAMGLTNSSHPGFVDVPASNTFHLDILRLAAAGVTKGCNPPSNDMFCPSRDVTRGEMTAFLHRASQLD